MMDSPRVAPGVSLGWRITSRSRYLCVLLFVLLGVQPLFTRPLLAQPLFTERTAELGVGFVHRHFGTGEKYMPENMAPGVAILDADGDGRLDIYLVQGAPIGPGAAADPSATNRLFRQRPDGTFEDVTEPTGTGDAGYGMGAAFGDVDADGDLDLYVTNFGRNTLFENRGDGTFRDVTGAAGVAAPGWSVGATLFDAGGDGDLDLYVTHYVDFAFDNHKFCGNARTKLRAYCHPDVYNGVPDVFYENLGPGDDGVAHFRDASRTAELARTANDKGLGVAALDADGDGRLDVYVTNDSTPNYLYLGAGAGGTAFREESLFAGVAVSGAGKAEASMGIAVGDVDADGHEDLFVTHLDQETNTLYRNLGGGMFSDATAQAGLAAPSLPWVGFGTVLFDADNDGDLDLVVLNGHIIDNIERFDASRRHRQPAQLFENVGGRFTEISDRLGVAEPLVGRGMAAGDLDGDGDLDLVLTQNGARALVLMNEMNESPTGRFLGVRLKNAAGAPDGFGARLELRAAGHRQVRTLLGAASYLSQSAPDAHFGLGETDKVAELRVRWPSGKQLLVRGLKADHLYLLTELP